ncbi:MAG: DNA polymerase III subunit gamma/tau [Clostridiales bacterium]|nr:DNA polymerase III subunit gamma/tau [Clostridiales bacterium]
MTYKALYREWRPQKFDEIVGQEHIITTLRNQIKSGNISHAYLFSGTRGTGKTSIAKIFARALNCLNVDGKNANPCNNCELCVGTMNESIMDVIEIDAASNNGVEHIRTIRENAGYAPSRGKYKIYIIDEVHMLSMGAFNALLKTLEEPPEHVIFILATTEPHKLPVTVISRCQRFNFRPVKTEKITERLSEVCKSVRIRYETKALHIIATNAKGSLRDALSILEQCISLANEHLTYSVVIDILGITNELLLKELVVAIIEKDASLALSKLQRISVEGNDVTQTIKHIVEFFRSLLMVKMDVAQESVYFGRGESKEILAKVTDGIKVERIVKIMSDLAEIETRTRYSTQPQIVLEIAVVTLCKEAIEGIDERLKKIEELINTKEVFKQQTSKKTLPVCTNTVNIVYKKNLEEKKISDETKKTNCNGHSERESSFAQQNEKAEEGRNDRNSEGIEKTWEKVLETIIIDKKAHLKAFLREGKMRVTNENSIVIEFAEEFVFHCETLNRKVNKEYILGILSKITGQQIGVSFIVANEKKGEERCLSEDIEKKLSETLPKDILEILE